MKHTYHNAGKKLFQDYHRTIENIVGSEGYST